MIASLSSWRAMIIQNFVESVSFPRTRTVQLNSAQIFSLWKGCDQFIKYRLERAILSADNPFFSVSASVISERATVC
jgi:hypothetical protein